jgi:LysM repeat protein
MRKSVVVLISLIIFIVLSIPPEVHAKILSLKNLSSASDVIDAVNDLRASRGLSPYSQNSILMSNAQSQAEYNLSIGTSTHVSADGLRPFQRALQAGYAVAGDISQGGFFSENVTAGVGMTADEAVKQWTQDDPHLNTMISPVLQDIGAGVAVSGNTYYYVIDCGLSTGGTPAIFTPPPSYNPPQSTLIPNTPNADGSIIYIVKSGDTLLGIAISYKISLDNLLTLNGLTIKSVIYTGQKVIIRAQYTPTPTMPTLTPTKLPTITPWSTTAPTLINTPLPSPPPTLPALPILGARRAVIIIAGAALLISALVVLAGIRRK